MFEALTDTGVVVNGARQVGGHPRRSCAAAASERNRAVPWRPGYPVRPPPRIPVRFVRHDGLMLIDEVQRDSPLDYTIAFRCLIAAYKSMSTRLPSISL